MDDQHLKQALTEARTVAVVGMSRNPAKAANYVPRFLQRAGYTVIPVNPFAENIDGRPCYPSLLDVPNRVDIVEIFRPSADVLAIVEEAIARHENKGDVNLIWLQLGIANPRAAALVAQAGIAYIEDRCMAIEIPRLFPGGFSL